MVFIVTRQQADRCVQTLQKFPFRGLVELLKTQKLALPALRMRFFHVLLLMYCRTLKAFVGALKLIPRKPSHHDQLNCKGCDLLGRCCGASQSKYIARSFCGFNDGGASARLVLRGLPGFADRDFVEDILRDVAGTLSLSDPEAGLRWISVYVRNRRDGACEAHVDFDHAELAGQVLELAKDILRARLEGAERAITPHFQGGGGGTLYAADLYGADPCDPELQAALEQTVFRAGCECLGWLSAESVSDGQQDDSPVPVVRIISAPHWLQRAMTQLQRFGEWRTFRLILPWQVFTCLHQKFTLGMPSNWVRWVVDNMRTAAVDEESLQDSAAAFRAHARGLSQMGDFPSRATRQVYRNDQFCSELEEQHTTLC